MTFLDTAYMVALSVRSDEWHPSAIRLEAELNQRAEPLVTTRAVCFEIGNSFSKLGRREVGIHTLKSIEQDALIEVIETDPFLYQRALDLFTSRPDKEWGLTDCASFIVMRDRAITDALTADVHFQQAGFRALLREDTDA